MNISLSFLLVGSRVMSILLQNYYRKVWLKLWSPKLLLQHVDGRMVALADFHLGIMKTGKILAHIITTKRT